MGIAQAQERVYSVTAFGSFTTSSKLFRHSDATDEITRGQFLPLDNIFSAGVELRRNIGGLRAQIGLSFEYISKSNLVTDPLPSIALPVADGFSVFPIELTGYFIIPFSGERVQLFMGGGVGAYIGFRTYEYAGEKAVVAEHKPGFGIHVVSGIEYQLTDLLSLRGMLKFRDVQFESVNRFTQTSVNYNGTTVNLPRDPLNSRMNIDGMITILGLVVHLE